MEVLQECYDEGHLVLIKSLLDANGIEFVVQNEHFGSLYPGTSLAFNARLIMVPEYELERARILLSRLDATPLPDLKDAG